MLTVVPRRRGRVTERLMLAGTAVLGAVVLGLTAAGALPSDLVLLAAMAAVGGIVVVTGRRAPFWVMGGAVVGTALASSVLPIAGPLVVGRFIFPLVLAAVAWQLPVGDRIAARRLVPITLAAFALTIPSTILSLEPTNSATKLVALLIGGIGVLGGLRATMMNPEAGPAALRISYAVLVLSNALYVLVVAPGTIGGRLQGWTINPNSLGALSAFGLVLALSGLVGSRSTTRGLLLCTVGAAAGMLLLTGSRNGLLAGILGTIAVLRAERMGGRFLAALGAAAIVAGGVALLQPPDPAAEPAVEVGQPFQRRGATDSGRIDRWSTAVDEIVERPTFGAGFDTTLERRFQWTDPRNPEGGHFHNSYLEAMVELGIPAALPLLAAGAFALSFLVRRAPARLSWAAGLGVAAASLAIFETGAITSGAILFFPFWLSVGCLVAMRREEAAAPAAGSLAP